MIPVETKKTIDDYVEKGWEPGHFVGAVLANDLKGAFASADNLNMPYMLEIVRYVYNEIPHVCRGSYEIIREWVKIKNEERGQEREANNI